MAEDKGYAKTIGKPCENDGLMGCYGDLPGRVMTFRVCELEAMAQSNRKFVSFPLIFWYHGGSFHSFVVTEKTRRLGKRWSLTSSSRSSDIAMTLWVCRSHYQKMLLSWYCHLFQYIAIFHTLSDYPKLVIQSITHWDNGTSVVFNGSPISPFPVDMMIPSLDAWWPWKESRRTTQSTGNGHHTTYICGGDWGMVGLWHCFIHIDPTTPVVHTYQWTLQESQRQQQDLKSLQSSTWTFRRNHHFQKENPLPSIKQYRIESFNHENHETMITGRFSFDVTSE